MSADSSATPGNSVSGLVPAGLGPVQELRARFDIYEETIIATQWGRDGVRRMEVAPEQVARVFAAAGAGTGLLPPGTLFWRLGASGPVVGILIAAGRRRVLWRDETGRITSAAIPFPRLVFMGENMTYKIFAVRPGRVDRDSRLFLAPLPNVYADGRICAGTAVFPVADADTILSAFEVFMGSEFNGDLARGRCLSFENNVLELWKKLRRVKRFPTWHLKEAELTLGDLLEDGPKRRLGVDHPTTFHGPWNG